MWYKSEVPSPIDYSYLDVLFDDREETNEFLRVFIRELEVAKANFHASLTRRNTQLFRQTYHNVSPHLEILKINHLNTLLQQARVKIMDTRQPFEDKALFMAAIATAFDEVISEVNGKLMAQP